MKECPACGLSGTKAFFELKKIPVSIGALWQTYASARSCPTGDMQLVYCPQCGLIYNAAFDDSRLNYDQNYNNSLHFSPLYQQYAEETAKRLVVKYDLRNKDIIEVGCGKGDFLILLCKYGDNAGVGFDRSYEDRELESELDGKVSFVNDLYLPVHATHQGDLICSRYVLEHIEKPVEFLKTLRGMIDEKRQPVIYFEVPNALLVFDKLSVWDLIYEHCLYFTELSLQYVFEVSGFEVLDTFDCFGDQFVNIEASPCSGNKNPTIPDPRKKERITYAVENFSDNFKTIMETWGKYLQQIRDTGKNAVLWGAGAKGVSFLNLCGVVDEIKYVVDINPNKKGNYIAGTGQEIISPEQLKGCDIDSVVILNPIYKDEISKMLGKLGISPTLVCCE